MADPKTAVLEVDIRLGFKANPSTLFKADGLLCACPFCQCREKDREDCTLCQGAGVIIKIKVPEKYITLCVIDGGKS